VLKAGRISGYLSEECDLIVYYNEKEKYECILDILLTDNATIFYLYVKRRSYAYEAIDCFLYIFNRYGLVVVFALV